MTTHRTGPGPKDGAQRANANAHASAPAGANAGAQAKAGPRGLRRATGLALLLALSFAGGACSTRTAYFSTQELQRAQCDRLTDLQELQRCRAQARQSYEDYQRQREAVLPAE